MRCVFLSACFAAVAVLPANLSCAQVTSDGTLGTIVSTTGLNHTITNGTAAGPNLFHSFQRFDIPTGGSATFDLVNTPAITTIFSRVTGGSISNIDGAIRTLNSTNSVSLFLMNPSGIIFGSNASLNIGGSFMSTTANSIKFADGSEFASTATPLPASLLTVNVPVGLQMGSNPANITVQGSGHSISPLSSATPLRVNSTPPGLQVAPGRTLALVGGNIQLDGGILTAPGGRLELGAVQPTTIPAVVGLRAEGNRWALDYGTLQQFGDIQMQRQALGKISNAPGSADIGAMQIRVRNLILQDGAALVWENQGSQPGTGIAIQASDSIQFLRRSQRGFASGIYSDARGLASPGAVTLVTQQMRLQEGGILSFRSFGSAAGSNVTVNASALQMVNSATNTNNIAIRNLGSGQGGNLTINTQRLTIQGGGSIQSIVQNAAGAGGNLTINARDSIELLSGANGIAAQAFFNSGAIGGTGNAGNLTVNTSRLVLRNGAEISSGTVGAGKGGAITINASESVDLSGTRTDPFNGFTRTGIQASGSVPSPLIRVVFGLTGETTGAAGSVIINTPQMRIADGATVSVKHDGSGNAGNLEINAGQLTVDNQSRITATTASGEGGNIILNLQKGLFLRRGSFISTEAGGAGSGGNITINSPVIIGFENSDIVANAFRGRGGNVQITTEGIFGLKFRPQLTPENDITASSQFGINGIVQINTIGVDPSAGLVNLPVNLVDPSRRIATGCGSNRDSSFVATGRGGIPQNPTQEAARNDRPWNDLRDPSAYQNQPRTQATAFKAHSTIVEASTLKQTNGQLELVAATERNLLMRVATCARAIDPAP